MLCVAQVIYGKRHPHVTSTLNFLGSLLQKSDAAVAAMLVLR